MRSILFICAAILFAAGLPSAVAQDTVPDSVADESISPDETVRLPSPATGNETGLGSEQLKWSITLLVVYCVLIVLASLVGGALPFVVELTHTRMQTIISFVGGLMLGIGVFHLMPHAVHELHRASIAANWMMVGIVMMFVLLRLFHFHNHEPVSIVNPGGTTACDHDHDHDHDHDGPLVQAAATGKDHSPAECHSHGHTHGLSWFGIAFGLSLHTLIDGLALAASVHAHAQQTGGMQLLGVATFLAVLLHKPLDAVSITSLMAAGGWTRRSMMLVNTGFSMMCPLGAVLFLIGVRQFAGYQQELLGTALAFSAGVFICISLSDLLPEMEFHTHNKVRLTVALGLGIMLSWSLTLLEQTHLH